jgi:hypothetical protein
MHNSESPVFKRPGFFSALLFCVSSVEDLVSAFHDQSHCKTIGEGSLTICRKASEFASVKTERTITQRAEFPCKDASAGVFLRFPPIFSK